MVTFVRVPNALFRLMAIIEMDGCYFSPCTSRPALGHLQWVIIWSDHIKFVGFEANSPVYVHHLLLLLFIAPVQFR